jgi:hypothetical protein
MKFSLSSRDIKFSNSCENFTTKYLLEPNKQNPNKNHQKIKYMLIRKKPVINLFSIEKLIHKNFFNAYSNDKNFYNIKVINDIISNEGTHVVAEFKDYLIKGDDSEFLQRYYTILKSYKYLAKIFDYYQSCSVIFPNYVILPESKYIYKNIQKKQIVIDVQQDQEEKAEKIKKGIIKIEEDDIVFTSKAIYSILDQTDTSNIRGFFGLKHKNEEISETPYNIFNMIEKEEAGALKKKISLKKKDKKTCNNINIYNVENKSQLFSKMKSDKKQTIPKRNGFINKSSSKNNKFIGESKSKSKSKSKTKGKNKSKANWIENKKHQRNSSTNNQRNNINLLNDLNSNYCLSNNIKGNNILNYNFIKPNFLSNNNITSSIIANNISNKKPNPFFNKKHRSNNFYNPFQSKKLKLNMLLNCSKPKQAHKTHRSSIKIKGKQEKSKSKKENFSFSLPPSFATLKVSNPKKGNTKQFGLKKNSSNSTSNLNKNKKKINRSKEQKDKQNKNNIIFNTIPIKINNNNFNNFNNFDLYMPSELEIAKDNKNNYCTIVPQVLNMYNLNIYKINSTNKSQMYNTLTSRHNSKKKNLSQKKINNQYMNKKIQTKKSFDHKNEPNLLRTIKNKKKRRVYNINKMVIEGNSNENNALNFNNIFEKEKKNGALTSRKFSSSPNKSEEENILKNILVSDIKNDNINKNKKVVIHMRKGVKKIKNTRENVPLTSRYFLNSSITRNKKKGNVIDKNHFNLRGGILGNSNSIINRLGILPNETNNNDTNTICSVKSIGHIVKMKKKSKPYNKPSLNVLITNNKQ